jgi:hypothetical protein
MLVPVIFLESNIWFKQPEHWAMQLAGARAFLARCSPFPVSEVGLGAVRSAAKRWCQVAGPWHYVSYTAVLAAAWEMRFRITEQPDGRIKLGLDRSDLERLLLWEEVNSKRLHTHVAS